MSYIEHLERFEKAIDYADTVETAEALVEARDRFRAACQPEVEALVRAVAKWREAPWNRQIYARYAEIASFALDARADEVAGKEG